MKSARNSEYKVIITYGAKAQLAQILRYLRQEGRHGGYENPAVPYRWQP